MAVETTPIVHIVGTEAALRAGLGIGQIGIASDTKRIIFNLSGTILVFAPEYVGLTLQDITAATIVANTEFQGDGGALSGLVGENITCDTGITGLTNANLSLGLAELKGLVTALTTAGYLPLSAGSGKPLTGKLHGTSFSFSDFGDYSIGAGSIIKIEPNTAGTVDVFLKRSDSNYSGLTCIGTNIGFRTHEGGFFYAPLDETDVKTIATREWVGGQFTATTGVKAATSAGLLLESHNGTDIALLGAGGGSSADFYGTIYCPLLYGVSALGTNPVFAARDSTQTYESMRVLTNGVVQFNDTTGTAWDTNVYRRSANVLGTDDSFQTPRIRLTIEGGYAVLYTAGENLAAGEIVTVSGTTDDNVIKAPADSMKPIGVVYATATSGNPVWIVVSGRAQVLLQNSTASTRGYWARTSITVAGRADITNANPPGGTIAALEVHATEIGHCLQSVTAGTDQLAWINMHFN